MTTWEIKVPLKMDPCGVWVTKENCAPGARVRSVDGCGVDFREDEKQFVIVNWRQVSHMPFIGWCSRKRVTWPLRLKICQIRWIFKTGRTDDRWRGDLQWQILRIFRVSSNNNRTTIAFVYVKEVCRCEVPVWSWISSRVIYMKYQIFCPNIAGFMLFASSNVYPHGKRRLYFQFSKKP